MSQVSGDKAAFRPILSSTAGAAGRPPEFEPLPEDHAGFLQLGDEDRRRLARILDLLEPRLPGIVAQYCDHLARYPEPAAVLRRVDRPQFEADVAAYLTALLRCDFSDAHVESRRRIGLAHGDGHLSHVWYTGSYHFLEALLGDALEALADSSEECSANRRALGKAMAYDLGLVMNAHVGDYALALAKRNGELMQEKASRAQCAQMLVHDMGMPLTTLSTATEVLARNPDDPAVFSRCIEVLRRNERRLNDMLRDMLDAYVSETASLHVAPEVVDLRALATEVVTQFDSPDIPEQPAYALDAPPSMPPVRADRALVRRVLWNLVDNATRYTPIEGRITVQLRVVPDEGDVIVRVQDSGPGVVPELRERIFDTFFSCAAAADAVAEGARRGTGLGLPFCRAVLDAHGRTITVEEPAAGHGTVFTFSLPIWGSD